MWSPSTRSRSPGRSRPDDLSTLIPWTAVVAADGKEPRRERGVKVLAFDPAMRSVAVSTGVITRFRDTPPDVAAVAVTVYAAETWLAGREVKR